MRALLLAVRYRGVADAAKRDSIKGRATHAAKNMMQFQAFIRTPAIKARVNKQVKTSDPWRERVA